MSTLGASTPDELIRSACVDVFALVALARSIRDGDEDGMLTLSDGSSIDLLTAYHGSIASRLDVALTKLAEAKP